VNGIEQTKISDMITLPGFNDRTRTDVQSKALSDHGTFIHRETHQTLGHITSVSKR
jgi:hypothetical protein